MILRYISLIFILFIFGLLIPYVVPRKLNKSRHEDSENSGYESSHLLENEEIVSENDDAETENGSNVLNENDGRRMVSIYKQNLLRLNAIVNTSANACEDFFAHACGNYENFMTALTTDSPSLERVPPFLINLQDRMDFFRENKDGFVSGPGRIIADLYNSCKSEHARPARRRQRHQSNWHHILHQVYFLASDIELYRHWPLMPFQVEHLTKTSNSGDGIDEDNSLNWMLLAAEMASHGMPTFMNIFFAEQTIFVEPGQVPSDCLNVRKLIGTLLKTLHGRHKQIAVIVAHELQWFCVELQGEAFPSNESENNDMVEKEESTEEEEEEEMEDINEHKEQIEEEIASNEVNHHILDQLDIYLKHFFSLLKLTGNEIERARKIPLDVPKMAHILRVLRRTEPRTILNFLLWHAYTELTTIDCYELTEEFSDLLYAEYWSWHVFQPWLSRDVALGVYTFQTARFQQLRHKQFHTLQKTDSHLGNWEQFLLQRRRRRRKQSKQGKVNCAHDEIEHMIRNYAERFWRPRQLERIYGGSGSTNDSTVNGMVAGNFYATLLRLRRHHLQNTFHTPTIDAEDSSQPLYWMRDFIHFAITFLRQPHYHNFVTHNFQLWHTHATQLPLYTSDTLQAASYCLDMQRHNIDANNSAEVQPLTEMEVETMVRFALAFQASYDDYQFWVEAQAFGFAEHFFLAHFGQDAQRILFYALAQQFCGRDDDRYSMQVNQTFMNLPAFQAAFNCDIDTPMNPIQKCFDTE